MILHEPHPSFCCQKKLSASLVDAITRMRSVTMARFQRKTLLPGHAAGTQHMSVSSRLGPIGFFDLRINESSHHTLTNDESQVPKTLSSNLMSYRFDMNYGRQSFQQQRGPQFPPKNSTIEILYELYLRNSVLG